jgi:hypothetical protein
VSHGVRRAPILPGKTIGDVSNFIRSERGTPPLDEEGGFESTVLEGGISQVFDIELTPGNWAVLCRG